MKENQNHIENNLNEMNDRNIDFNRDISGEVKDVKTEMSQMKEN